MGIFREWRYPLSMPASVALGIRECDRSMKNKPSSLKSRPKACPRCRHTMQQKEVDYACWYNNAIVAVVNQVPAWVCNLCSYQVYEASVQESLKHTLKDYKRLGKSFPIPSTTYREIDDMVWVS